MEWLDYVVMGIVQGITEFFPVSSDGHLALAGHFLNFQNPSLLFDVMLHFGTLGSLIVIYRQEVKDLISRTWSLFLEVLRAGPKQAFLNADRWVLYVWIMTFVTGLSGIFMEHTVESLSTNLIAAGIGFLITSLFLWGAVVYAKKATQSVVNMPIYFPVILGLAQGLALLPGVSRSGSTICLALILGARREQAGKFSFVGAIPIIFLASVYEFRKIFDQPVEHVGPIALGVLVSFITGFFAIRLLILMLTKLSLWPFAVYTLFAAALSFAAGFGWLQ